MIEEDEKGREPKPKGSERASKEGVRIGRFIRERRQRIGKSLEWVARAAGITKGTLYSVEIGNMKIGKAETIHNLALALFLEPDDLFLEMDRVPGDINQLLLARPSFWVFLRRMRGCTDREIEILLGQLLSKRKVNDVK